MQAANTRTSHSDKRAVQAANGLVFQNVTRMARNQDRHSNQARRPEVKSGAWSPPGWTLVQ
jgi:hypothetical protein